MIEFRQILFPVDFSDHTRATAPSVKAMAGHFGAEIIVLHVNDNPGPGTDPRAILEQFVAQELGGVRATQQIVQGDPAEEIVKYAHDRPVDLIMMPTRGHGVFRAMLLGSITAKVLHDASCPVWTGVHAEESMSHPPDRWKRLLCAIDDADDKDVPVVKWAAEFALLQDMDLQLVHVVAGAEGMWTHETDPGMYQFLFDAARGRLAELQAKAGTAGETMFIGGTVGSAVHRAALEKRADLILIGRSASHELRGNAYAIIRQAPCPVISI
jgi:nucleotide-binding universal stress UspA family protein